MGTATGVKPDDQSHGNESWRRANAALAEHRPNTVEYVRHDGGVSEATFDGKEWQSDDNSLRIWLNQVAAAGVERALSFGCNAPGTEAKRRADEAAAKAVLVASPEGPQPGEILDRGNYDRAVANGEITPIDDE